MVSANTLLKDAGFSWDDQCRAYTTTGHDKTRSIAISSALKCVAQVFDDALLPPIVTRGGIEQPEPAIAAALKHDDIVLRQTLRSNEQLHRAVRLYVSHIEHAGDRSDTPKAYRERITGNAADAAVTAIHGRLKEASHRVMQDTYQRGQSQQRGLSR